MSAPAPEPEYEQLLYQVASLYYESGQTQEQIGRALHLTRWKVGRMLTEAREVGIVRIDVVHPRSRIRTAERALVERYGLRDAVVVAHRDGATAPHELTALVARAAADYLAALRPAPRLLGVSWGRTLDAVAAALPSGWTSGVHVVQVNGGLSRSRTPTSAHDMASRIAHHGAGTVTLLPVPAIVEQEATRRALESDRAVSDVLDLAARADAYLFSPGGMTRDSVLVDSGYITPADLDRLSAAGAVGDVMSRFIDAEGRVVDAGLDGRTLGLSLDALRAGDTSVAVVAGPAKLAVCRAVLAGRMCKVLITEQRTARSLLEPARTPSGSVT
ncbi:sugar-binding transcriptional regulator [Allonocardiopsis opalescens]|uniref:Deoxyribonucleoside regulator n=1 Tax=Allonocardiopsis opalescens TaxID=1144618 RepID=A0A2T0Q9N8_9ACTN|nr:sugar-binding domain-containing protein [Allonocardiopsis opalescens]PRY00609.1 deoxyribonucleoside regulator [Allonocardiopsis opalescens]